eukprot:TRINITY_DN14281_c0_g1_i1.p1 TRINITY_DN14281_c0_g1~~TRINITY_DN14281_c0_g1_i1.p1  ORF type:complete len:558 (+),score=165.21 TRINITY_DN14281_c0_g1_i1:1222-2895(+)
MESQASDRQHKLQMGRLQFQKLKKNHEPVVVAKPEDPPPVNLPEESRELSQQHQNINLKIKILEETNNVIALEKDKVAKLIENDENLAAQQQQTIQELQEKLANAENERNVQRDIRKNSEKQLAELLRNIENQNLVVLAVQKGAEIDRLNMQLLELKEKYTNETRSQQQRIVANRTKIETINIEKSHVELDIQRLKGEKTELRTSIEELNKNLQKLQTEKSQLDLSLDTILKKNWTLESKIQPLDKKLAKLESELVHFTNTTIKDMEDKSSHLKRLEVTYLTYSEERDILSQKLVNLSKLTETTLNELKRDISEKSKLTKNQVHNLEVIISQKNSLMTQLSNEVKRNNMLLQKNNELKSILRNRLEIIDNYEKNKGKENFENIKTLEVISEVESDFDHSDSQSLHSFGRTEMTLLSNDQIELLLEKQKQEIEQEQQKSLIEDTSHSIPIPHHHHHHHHPPLTNDPAPVEVNTTPSQNQLELSTSEDSVDEQKEPQGTPQEPNNTDTKPHLPVPTQSYGETENSEYLVLQTDGWLTYLPLFGKYFGKRTLQKKAEIII